MSHIIRNYSDMHSFNQILHYLIYSLQNEMLIKNCFIESWSSNSSCFSSVSPPNIRTCLSHIQTWRKNISRSLAFSCSFNSLCSLKYNFLFHIHQFVLLFLCPSFLFVVVLLFQAPALFSFLLDISKLRYISRLVVKHTLIDVV